MLCDEESNRQERSLNEVQERKLPKKNNKRKEKKVFLKHANKKTHKKKYWQVQAYLLLVLKHI